MAYRLLVVDALIPTIPPNPCRISSVRGTSNALSCRIPRWLIRLRSQGVADACAVVDMVVRNPRW